MKKRICFFSVGFAFNRLVRLKFYEKIFPQDVEIFLYTTNKYSGKESLNYQKEWTSLTRTKIITEQFHPVKTFLNFRKFCKENKIDRVFNLGFHNSWPILFYSTAFYKDRDYCLNILTDIFKQHYLVEKPSHKIKELLNLVYIYPGVLLSRKSFFTDSIDAKRAPKFFLSKKNKMKWLAAPVNTDLFIIKNKIKMRKKLHLPPEKNIVIFVGRINYLKCSDILKKLIENNSDTHFIVIGRLLDPNYNNFKPNNMTYIESLSSNELVEYYSASDLSFCLNRGGGGIGLSTCEALSCGVPAIVSKEFKLKESPSLYQIKVSYLEANSIIASSKLFSIKNKKMISNQARKYVIDNYSDKVWKEEYINSYLN